jgi:predicted ATPase
VLIRFEASNYRSIANPVELSMVAIDRDRPEARDQPMLGESLLPVAAVFGPNASGKSNIVAAFAWVRDAVQNSMRAWDDGIPVEPFAFGVSPSMPSEFTIEVTIDGVRFDYLLAIDREKVRYEALFHYPERKRRRIFERDGAGFKIQRGLGGISGTRELLTERTLALSVARRFDEPLVSGFVRDLLRTQTLGFQQRPSHHFGDIGLLFDSRLVTRQSTMRWFEEGDQSSLFGDDDELGVSGDRDQALALLRLADLGIDDVVIDMLEFTFPGTSDVRRKRKVVRLVHRVTGESAPLDFASESEGTRTWFDLIGPVLTALRHGSLLLFDELDASLHPTLSAQLIRLFHDPGTNPSGAQLVFTSHDTSLLNHLNRDEVWLTTKRPDGSTRLGALAEFAGERVRKSQNLENAYLHGRFGALPQVDQTALLRALGLIG